MSICYCTTGNVHTLYNDIQEGWCLEINVCKNKKNVQEAYCCYGYLRWTIYLWIPIYYKVKYKTWLTLLSNLGVTLNKHLKSLLKHKYTLIE